MGNVSFTRPIDQQVNNHQGLETALAKAFKQVFTDVFKQQVQDMLDYGCPHLGSQTVIERFSKQDGLVVLRRPLTSDTLMRVIYANWSSLASERGLGFLEFVLRMIWMDQWQIKRLWHPIKTYLNYPKHITDEEKPEHFLTSRLRISIDDTVDTSEIIELSPILRRLVPANVVLKVHSKALDVELGDSAIGVGVYGKVYQVIDFSDHGAESEIEHGWSDWIVNSAVAINSSGIAHYTAYKTNQREYYDSYANLDLTEAIIKSLHDSDMQQWQAVKDACNQLTGNRSYAMDADNNRIKYFGDIANAANLQYAYRWRHEVTSAYGYEATAEKACMRQAASAGRTFTHIGSSSGGWTWCYASGASWQVLYEQNPYYNPNATGETFYVSFETIAQKIISNASSSNQGTSIFAEAYLENVAQSIFSTDESKQFVKITDLIDLFELNKYLRL